ncbi:hypothetical protein [Succinatimonas hippei]|uniref:hypothetical protein n=1 Tax=Succinatimonas hippei TaxID=626938 RepID=UPI0026F174CE|nr:hypothetical protein [Succinatimonas hippei]
MKAKLLIASAVASSVLLSGCITESMGEAILMHLAVPTDVKEVQHKVTLTQNEQKIFNTLLAAKDGSNIRESRKKDVTEYFAQNQSGKVMDSYDYIDLTFYLASVKAIAKASSSISDPCIHGDAKKCDIVTSENSNSLTKTTVTEWEKLLEEGGITIDEKHRKILDNIAKGTQNKN